LGHVAVEGVRLVSRVAAVLADIQLVAALLVAVGDLESMQFTAVGLEGTALGECLVTQVTPVRANTWVTHIDYTSTTADTVVKFFSVNLQVGAMDSFAAIRFVTRSQI
jgi:hypothetical protein